MLLTMSYINKMWLTQQQPQLLDCKWFLGTFHENDGF